MAFESEFLALMPHTVEVATRTGVNTRGAPEHGAYVERRCRIVHKPTQVLDADGREVVSKVTIYMAGDFGTTPKDKVRLPVGAEPREPKILAVDHYPDEDGPHHEVIRA